MSTNRVLAALEQENPATALASCPEDQWFDRKSSRIKPQDLGPHFVAFANAEGGILAIGAGEDKPDRDRLVREWQQVAADFTVPPVRAHVSTPIWTTPDGREEWLGIIEIESSEGVHETQNGNCYLRIGDETRKLSFAQRQELHFDKGHSSFDSRPAAETSMADLDNELVAAYRSAASTKLDDRTLLVNRGLLTRTGDVTNAGILLFGRDPQSVMPNSDVRLIRYRGVDRGQGRTLNIDADSDVRIGGTLPEIIDQAASTLDEWVPARRALADTGRFERVPVIPRDVWLEALVNAVVHRSYSLSGDHIRVEVFDDRIEVTSPGRFPGLARLDDPENVARFSRNPRIARVLVDLRIVRELGEGIRRMFADMRDGGLRDPEYRQNEGAVTVVLRTDSRIPAEVQQRLPRGSMETLRALESAHRPLGTGDVEELVGMARPTVIRILRALRDEGLVSWSGKSSNDPRAAWEAPGR